MKKDESTLASRITSRMNALNLTETSLAKRTNGSLSQASIHKLKTGTAKNTRFIIELSVALECDPTWLAIGQPNASDRNLLTHSEYKVLEQYRSLNREDQLLVENILKRFTRTK